MTDVEIAIRLGWETRLDTTVILSFFQIIGDDLLNKIQYFLFGRIGLRIFCHKNNSFISLNDVLCSLEKV